MRPIRIGDAGPQARIDLFQFRQRFPFARTRIDQFPLVPPPLGSTELRDARHRKLVGYPALGRVGQDGHRPTVLQYQIKGDLLEEALHAQERREVGFVEYAIFRRLRSRLPIRSACVRPSHAQSVALTRMILPSGPSLGTRKARFHTGPAGRNRSDQRNSFIAAMSAAGALRLGQ